MPNTSAIIVSRALDLSLKFIRYFTLKIAVNAKTSAVRVEMIQRNVRKCTDSVSLSVPAFNNVALSAAHADECAIAENFI